MTTQQKHEVKAKLQNYVSSFSSQKQAANTLKDTSETTVIHILSEKWQHISDAMWLTIANQLVEPSSKVRIAETLNFQTLILYFTVAQDEGATVAIIGGAGYGKTVAGKYFAKVNRSNNVYYLTCAEYWNKKMFLAALLQAMGVPNAGMNVGEMMEDIVFELRRQRKPLVILDEIDKLTDPVLKFFITLYNELNGACGFVWTSTNNIEKRMKRGLNSNKNGYQELFSRIGQRFLELPTASYDDVKMICIENGITDQEEISTIHNDCNGDLRRVERHFLKDKVKKLRKRPKAA